MDRTVETLNDRLSIMEICMSWHWHLDLKQWDQLEQLMTDEVAVPSYAEAHNAEAGASNGTVRPRSEAIAGLRVLMEGLETQHLVTGHHVIALNGNDAACVGHSFNMHIGPPQPMNAENKLMHANRYQWNLKRTPDGWRIFDHTVERVWGWGNEAVHHNAARQTTLLHAKG